jgi:hypothetical protein
MASKIWKFICMIWRPTFFGKVFDNWRFNWLQPSQNAFVYTWAGKECARVGGGVGREDSQIECLDFFRVSCIIFAVQYSSLQVQMWPPRSSLSVQHGPETYAPTLGISFLSALTIT